MLANFKRDTFAKSELNSSKKVEQYQNMHRDPWFIQSACGAKYWESQSHLSSEYFLIATAMKAASGERSRKDVWIESDGNAAQWKEAPAQTDL